MDETDTLLTVIVVTVGIFIVNVIVLMIGVWKFRPIIEPEVEDEADYPFI